MPYALRFMWIEAFFVMGRIADEYTMSSVSIGPMIAAFPAQGYF